MDMNIKVLIRKIIITMKVTVVPFRFSALGIIAKGLIK